MRSLVLSLDGPTRYARAPCRWYKPQIALGESVPSLPILDRLRVSAERLEAEQGLTADGEKVIASR